VFHQVNQAPDAKRAGEKGLKKVGDKQARLLNKAAAIANARP
jgi:hypothetical protein